MYVSVGCQKQPWLTSRGSLQGVQLSILPYRSFWKLIQPPAPELMASVAVSECHVSYRKYRGNQGRITGGHSVLYGDCSAAPTREADQKF